MKTIRDNIKGLPEGGDFYTEVGYSQTYPYEVVRRTAKTITVRAIKTKPDPEWKPEMHVGGFSAHCSNQQSQTWLFDGYYDVEKTFRPDTKTAQRNWRAGAQYFYDYNF